MIIRQSIVRPGRCIFCSLLPQPSRTVTTRADLAIPRHNLLEERIMGPTADELRALDPPERPFSSPKTPGILQKHRLMQYWKQNSGKFGSEIDYTQLPGKTFTQAPSADEVTLELLMASQTHMGHSRSLWNPMNSRYIFGVRQGMHIISLEATASHLKRAARVVEGVAENGGTILFVGTRKGQRNHVVAAAKMSGGCHLFTRWVPGTITNGRQLLRNCNIVPVDLEDREITGWEEQIKENLPVLKPDLVVCMNPLENKTLLHECALHTIPSIGVIDTDADPTTVTYPIPANDDSLRCIKMIAGVLGKAGEKGRLARLQKIKAGQDPPFTPFDLREIAFENSSETADKAKEKELLTEEDIDEDEGGRPVNAQQYLRRKAS